MDIINLLLYLSTLQKDLFAFSTDLSVMELRYIIAYYM